MMHHLNNMRLYKEYADMNTATELILTKEEYRRLLLLLINKLEEEDVRWYRIFGCSDRDIQEASKEARGEDREDKEDIRIHSKVWDICSQ